MATTYKKGDSDTRPWGRWEVLESSPNYCVKKITVNPNGILSLQLHHYRQEHWIIAEGEALVTLGEEQIIKKESKKFGGIIFTACMVLLTFFTIVCLIDVFTFTKSFFQNQLHGNIAGGIVTGIIVLLIILLQ